MPRFKVKIPGHLYHKWPSGEEITLADCCFTSGNNDREFIVHTEIDAENKEQARRNGRKICLDAIHLLEFCIEEQVDLDERRVCVRRKESDITTGWLLLTTDAIIVEDSSLTTEQLEVVKDAQNALASEQNAEKKESLMRAIHWQALGRRETKSQIDRFIKFWIALEVLVEGKGNKLVKKVKKSLTKLYPYCEEQKVRDTVGRIYGIRGYIVHFGTREPEFLEEKLKQLEAILGDLLRLRLGLSFKAFAQQYFL